MMKKLFTIAALAFVLMGAGCLKEDKAPVIEGDWTLTFDLPEGWYMLRPYGDQAPNLEAKIAKLDSAVTLQSTNKYAFRSSGFGLEQEEIDALGGIETSFAQISVMKLDPRRVIPSEAEDMGNGFLRERICEENDDCRIAGGWTHKYYLKTPTLNYQFDVAVTLENTSYQEATDLVEGIILSAKEVTATE